MFAFFPFDVTLIDYCYWCILIVLHSTIHLKVYLSSWRAEAVITLNNNIIQYETSKECEQFLRFIVIFIF